jgi:NhaP-type Na+/H+ or K+/H+ antiporter
MNIVGAIIFGVVVGFITYRTLVRTTDKATVSDLATVIAAIGGGAVTALFDRAGAMFGYYTIGLLAGMVGYFLIFLKMNGREQTSRVMSD